MKHLLRTILLFLASSGAVWGGQVPFVNRAVLTSPTNINSTRFENFGTIDFSLLNNFTNVTGSLVRFQAGTPFSTRNTLFFTNAASGVMFGGPGFKFDTETGGSIHPAAEFVNQGRIVAQDFPTIVDEGIVLTPAGTGSAPFPPGGRPIPSQLTINAANIVNSGSLAVGNVGLLKIIGRNVDLSYGILTAGSVSDVDSNALELNTLSAEQYEMPIVGGTLYTADSEGIYDLVWGITNGLKQDISTVVTGTSNNFFLNLPPINAQSRGGFGNFGGFFDFGSRNLTAFAYKYTIGGATNIYYNVVFVNTNFADPNVFVKVGFSSFFGFNLVPKDPNNPNTGDPSGANDVVQFGQRVVDKITGETVTNSIYLEDDGATLAPVSLAQNVAYSADYSRPDNFEITTAQLDFFPPSSLVSANTTFDPALVYNPTEFGVPPAYVLMTNSIYEAEVGRDPETLDGVFADLSETNFFIGGDVTLADIPDLTNEPGRIEIHANHLNLRNTRLRTENLLTIDSASTVGAPLPWDWGVANLNLGSITNSLLVSNVVPDSFQRLRGNIEAYSSDWVNIQTNALATNEIHYHFLFVAHNLQSSFVPTIRNLALTSTNAVLEDSIRVINHAVFNTRNLTIDSLLTTTENAGDVSRASMPNLRNLFITTNGGWEVDNLLDIGFNPQQTASLTVPYGRPYSVLSITNQGFILATAPTFEARTIENDGLIDTLNNGSVILAANKLGLGLAGLSANSIISDGAVTLSANIIEASNSTINASQLILTPGTRLTDFIIGTLGTNEINGASVLDNFWSVNDELNLTRKPLTGDLYGTEIRVIARDGAPSVVTWAGVDRGDTLNGFLNNTVVGHLVLDRLTNTAVLQFNAAGRKNALYVNYLELADASASDYQHNLYIDPRLTIYFAAANVPQNKLTKIFPQLVFATNALAQAGASPDALAAHSLLVPSPTAGVAPISSGFTPNPGVYNGLFIPDAGVSADNSGFFNFALNKNGAFSGRLLMGAFVLPFSGKLDSTGAASVGLKTVSIQFAVDSGGAVIGEASGDGWEAALNGARASVGTAANPSPNAGRYRIALPGPGAPGPSAESFGTVTVNDQGIVTSAGRLADGAAFSQATRIWGNGQWPFFAYAPARKDLVIGWLSLTGDHAGLSGMLKWVKPAEAAYPEGFSATVQVLGTATATTLKHAGANGE